MPTLTMEAKTMEAKNELTNSEIKDSKSSSKSSLHIVLAESKLEIIQSLLNELRKDNHVITTCKTIEQLNQESSGRKPDLLIIGTLAESSCLEVHRQYSQKWEELSIILLAPMLDVHEYFRSWAIARGVYDVLSSYPEKLPILRQAVQNLAQDLGLTNESIRLVEEVANDLNKISASSSVAPSQPISLKQVLTGFDQPITALPTTTPVVAITALTYQEALEALQQITNYSMNYFGGMAIANYWKKSQTAVVSEHPWLQCLTIDHRGAIAYFESEIPSEILISDQIIGLRLWVKGFLNECDRIIGGYTQMLGQMDISDQVKQVITS